MSSDIDQLRLAGEVLGQVLGGLFGSKKDSLVADSPPSFGFESPYFKGHPSYKSPGLRTADFVHGWDDNPDFKRYLDDVRRIESGRTPGIVDTDIFGGYSDRTPGFGDMDGYGLPKDMPEDMKREVLKRYPIT